MMLESKMHIASKLCEMWNSESHQKIGAESRGEGAESRGEEAESRGEGAESRVERAESCGEGAESRGKGSCVWVQALMLVSFRGHELVCVCFLVYGCKHQAWSRFLCKTKFKLRGSPSEKPGEKPGEKPLEKH